MDIACTDHSHNESPTSNRTISHYLLSLIIIAIYGIQVCPFIESLTLIELAPVLFGIMAIQLFLHQQFHQRLIQRLPLQQQATKLLQVELLLFMVSAVLLLFYNTAVHDFPIASGLKMILGYTALGFFVAIDLSLFHEHHIARTMTTEDEHHDVDNNYFPLTKKLTLTASAAAIFIMGIIFLVINKDLEWLMQTEQALPLAEARRAILLEVGFIVIVFLGHTLNTIRAYTRNLDLFFQHENNALKDATHGKLNGAVPISTHDEFGIMAKHTNQMIAGLRQVTHELQLTRDVTIMSLATLAETRDNETGAHLLRTQRYVQTLAKQLQKTAEFSEQLSDETIDLLFKSAPLHDIGKVGIPDHILLKPGKLTAEEFDIMKTHPLLGSEALFAAEEQLGSNSFLHIAGEITASHHEKWDGSGYPNGLHGEQIPLSGRLMALADVYDALISKRVYKPAFSHEKARQIIMEGKGTHFDPRIIDAFITAEDQFIDIAQRYNDDNHEETMEA